MRGRVVQRGRLRAGDAHHPEEQLQWEMDMAPTSAHPGAAIDDVGEDGAYPRFVDTGVGPLPGSKLRPAV
ncbi:hypothetical protein Kosp01_16860 [Kocuria sp. NBRC 114282]|nr:hypothetical protein Kosp01_16860 [Kocuria sp. NBRC 114282]